jgi:hypothetical protein
MAWAISLARARAHTHGWAKRASQVVGPGTTSAGYFAARHSAFAGLMDVIAAGMLAA